MLHPVFDHFTTATVVHPNHYPQAEDIVLRLFGLYPIASLCVADPDSKKAPAMKPEKRPAWRRRPRGWIDVARKAELQRVAALLERKSNKTEAEVRVLARLQEIIEAAQTHASHPGTTTAPTV